MKILLAIACCLLTSCFALQRGGLFSKQYDQVFVPYFFNETFYRDVEFQITEQLVGEILSSPGLHLSSKEDAEVYLIGRVLRVRQRVLSEDPDTKPTSLNTSITVEVQMVDARTGEVLKTQEFRRSGEFVESRGEDVAFARSEVFRFLARDIVRMLETDF
jgi:hypothetical protein